MMHVQEYQRHVYNIMISKYSMNKWITIFGEDGADTTDDEAIAVATVLVNKCNQCN